MAKLFIRDPHLDKKKKLDCSKEKMFITKEADSLDKKGRGKKLQIYSKDLFIS